MSKSVSKRDYYDVLGVSRSASDSEIKSAYRKLAMKHHPDRNPGDAAAEESFKEAAEAYAVLADTDKRSAYDRLGHAGVSSAAGGGFDPTVFTGFEDILGGLGDIFGRARRWPTGSSGPSSAAWAMRPKCAPVPRRASSYRSSCTFAASATSSPAAGRLGPGSEAGRPPCSTPRPRSAMTDFASTWSG